MKLGRSPIRECVGELGLVRDVAADAEACIQSRELVRDLLRDVQRTNTELVDQRQLRA